MSNRKSKKMLQIARKPCYFFYGLIYSCYINNIGVRTLGNKNNTKENKRDNVNTKDKKQKNMKKTKKPRKVLRAVVAILIIFVISVFAFLGYKIHKNGGGLSGLLATVLGESEETLEDLEPIQILIMGISGVDDYKLADTIMVASYNPKTQSASLMSIPRDTYVGKKNRKTATQNYIASYKINTVFRNGTNIPEAIDRINDLTGLELENYVIIDTKALVKLVDAIGGVTFDVPIDMDYEDSSQDLYIHLKAGEQLIDGAKAEQLLRFRHNDDGSTYPSSYGQQDLGRMRTQREFITATLKQTLKMQNLPKLKKIMDIANENVNTNIDFALLKKYLPYAVNFDADNIQTGMLPGDVEMCNGVSIYVANKADSAELVNKLFPVEQKDSTDEEKDNTTTTTTTETTKSTNTTNMVKDVSTSNNDEKKSDVKIQVLNGSSSESNLTEVVKKLKEAGYTVSKQGTTNVTSKTSIINRTNQSDEIISNIKQLLGTASTSTGSETSKVDVTIVIGKDYK